MFTSLRTFRTALPAALLALSPLALLCHHQAQAQEGGTVIQHPYPIGRLHAQTVPYSFTGRVFNGSEFGSGTLVRRHTILTAAHVLYTPGTGFGVGFIFQRGLYGGSFLSQNQAASVNVLSGYQNAANAAPVGTETFDSGARDLGFVLTNDAPVDDNWGEYLAKPGALTDDSGRFILGYPGVTFNGRTMTYVVPTTSFVQVGALNSGFFQNGEFTTEPGNSGGPIYSVQNGQQLVVGELTSGQNDPTAEFNTSQVRAIDLEADRFMTSGEYTSGLITGVKFTGPTSVNRGQTATFKTPIQFQVISASGVNSTIRYKELTLLSDNAGTPSLPLVTIRKVSNRKFKVTFDARLRSGTTVTLSAAYLIPTPPTPGMGTGTGSTPTADVPTLITGSTFKVKIN